MFGESPIALPLTFKNTKFPAIKDRMKTLIKNREEALAAHELAHSHMADRRKSTVAYKTVPMFGMLRLIGL